MSASRHTVLAAGLPVVLAAAGALVPGMAGAGLLYPLLGILPGLVIARALPLETGPVARLALGLAVAPLVVAALGWALLMLGVPPVSAARTLAALAALLWMITALRRPVTLPGGEPGARFALVWAAVAGVLVLLPMLLSAWLRVRSDTWIHAGIVEEILARGVPPEDPRFAGLPLNYVWFFNLFIALVCALRGDSPFWVMPYFNAVTLAATLLVAWVTARRLWGESAARGAIVLTGVGFNAGVWMLWPLGLARPLLGHDRGWSLVHEYLSDFHIADTHVIWTLSAPFASMASFLDKFLLGTAVAYAYLMMQLHLWALMAWLISPRRRTLVWIAAAAAGTLLFHGVVGLSYLPVVLATMGVSALLAFRWRWLPDFRRLLAPAVATIVGALAAAPYTLSISRGWSPERSGLQHRFIAFDVWMVWTLVSALLVVLWIARRSLRETLAMRQSAPALLALLAAGLAAFASIVKLPLSNHLKFVYETFVPVALLAGAALAAESAAWTRRLGRMGAAVLATLVFAVPPALTLFGYLADPTGRTSPEAHPLAAELRLFEWARRETPREAVFVDRNARSDLMVRSGRQLWLGTRHGPELAAFPRDQILVRSAVEADLYGELASRDRDVEQLATLGRPVYVIYRASDFAGGEFPANRMAEGPGPFVRVYDRDGFVVYHLPSLEPSGTP